MAELKDLSYKGKYMAEMDNHEARMEANWKWGTGSTCIFDPMTNIYIVGPNVNNNWSAVKNLGFGWSWKMAFRDAEKNKDAS